MPQGSLNQIIRFLGKINRQTQRYARAKVNTEDTLSWPQEFFLQVIIKDRSNGFTLSVYMCDPVSVCVPAVTLYGLM